MKIRHVFIMGLMIISSVQSQGADDDPVVFKDDFENGFSPLWAQHDNGIQVVPENPDIAKGNHVVRFTTNRACLSTPLRNVDWKAAEEQDSVLKKGWGDYEFSFRWRINKWDKADEFKGNLTLFNPRWRCRPYQDNQYLCNLVFINIIKGKTWTWGINGPLVPWFDVNSNFDQKNIEKDNRLFPVGGLPDSRVDHEWHTFKVVVQGERNSIYMDDKLYFIGSDNRTTYGGIQIWSWWNNEIAVEFDIDDVIVKKGK